MRTILAAASLVLVVVGESGYAQQPREKPRELAALRQFVGDWTTEVTSKPAEWTPQEVKYRTSNHVEFVPNGWFLQHLEVNYIVGEPEKVTKAIWFQTFDTTSKKYVTWWFQSSGLIGQSIGTWDATKQAFTSAEVEPPPGVTSRFEERFRGAGTIDGSLIFSGNNGRRMFEMVWTRTRQENVAPDALLDQWSKLGAPIQPIPDEVKRLEPFVGTKDVEFTQRPSIVSPKGGTAKMVSTGAWILDGRFVLTRMGQGERESLFVVGYDTNKRAYRYVRLGSNGEHEENIGQWNEASRSFEWRGVNGPAGLTRTSTSRLLGNGTIETQILSKTQDGRIHLDITNKATPRK